MVQIRQYEAQQGLDAPAYPTPEIDNSIGRALGAVGNALGNLGDHFAARDRRKSRFDAAIAYERLNEETNQDLIDRRRKVGESGTDGTGLHDGFVADHLRPRTEAFLSTIKDPELRDEYARRVELFRDKWSNDAANNEYEIGNAFSRGKINEVWDNRAQGIAANPAAVDSYVKELEDLIDTAPNLTADQRREMKSKVRSSAPAIVAETLRQSDPETLYFATGNGSRSERLQFLTRKLAGVIPPAGDGEPIPETTLAALLNKHNGDAEAAIVEAYGGRDAVKDWEENGRKARDKALQATVDGAMNALGAAKLASGRGSRTDAAGPSAAEMIAGFEGFRASTYWDVNHHRVGYGSDTITRPDGSVATVQKGATVTKEDALRDLRRRVAGAQKTLASQIGDKWGNLPEGARSAITSVFYNYGRLPKIVLAAAQTGEKARVADAILSLAGHNGGINANRRRKEAMAALHGANTVANLTGKQSAEGGQEGAPEPPSDFVSPVFADMPVLDLQKWKNQTADLRVKAEDTTRQELALSKAEFNSLIENDVASIEQSGQSPIAPTDLEDVSMKIFTALGPERYTKWTEDRAVAQRVHDLTSDRGSLPEDAISARIAAVTPKGGPDAALQQRVYDQVAKRMQETTTLRANDPGLAVQEMPGVAESAARVDWAKPAAVRDYLAQVEAAQTMLGMPQGSLLPKAQAEQLGTQIRNVLRDNRGGMEEEATKSFLQSLERVYGSYADDIFTQAYETILDKDLSKDTRALMSQTVLEWASGVPGMIDSRFALANELAATDRQPDLSDDAPAGRSWWGYLTGAPEPPPAPDLPPRVDPVPITIDGVPPDAVDVYLKNPGSMKIQSMFRNIYGGDALKAMQKQLRERGQFGGRV